MSGSFEFSASEGSDISSSLEVPRHFETLPDGRESLVIGDVEGLKDFNHLQGENPLGFQGTCGIVSCEDVLHQFGNEGVSEGQLVEYAALHGLCNTEGAAGECGGTTVSDQARILSDWGVPAGYESGVSLESLAARVEEGRGVIAEVNSGTFWGQPSWSDLILGGADHAVVITGVARDPVSGEIQGFFVNDSGVPSSGRFVDAATMQTAFTDAGGMAVTTTVPRNLASVLA